MEHPRKGSRPTTVPEALKNGATGLLGILQVIFIYIIWLLKDLGKQLASWAKGQPK